MTTNIWIWIWRDDERTIVKSLLATITKTDIDSLRAILKTVYDAIGNDSYQLTNSVDNGNNIYTVEFAKKVKGVLQPLDTFEDLRKSLYAIISGMTKMVGSYSPMQIELSRNINYLTNHDIKFKLHYFGA
jgi:hypothetical protein